MTTIFINQRTINTFSTIPPLLDPEVIYENDIEEIAYELSNTSNDAFVPTNVYGDEEGYELRLLAPGFKKENINVDVSEANVLTISAGVEKKQNDNLNCFRREFGTVSFSRSFQLPEDALTEEIITEYSEGIIKLWLPKVREGMIDWV